MFQQRLINISSRSIHSASTFKPAMFNAIRQFTPALQSRRFVTTTKFSQFTAKSPFQTQFRTSNNSNAQLLNSFQSPINICSVSPLFFPSSAATSRSKDSSQSSVSSVEFRGLWDGSVHLREMASQHSRQAIVLPPFRQLMHKYGKVALATYFGLYFSTLGVLYLVVHFKLLGHFDLLGFLKKFQFMPHFNFFSPKVSLILFPALFVERVCSIYFNELLVVCLFSGW